MHPPCNGAQQKHETKSVLCNTVHTVKPALHVMLQLYISPVTEHFETKYMNNSSGLWAIRNWLVRTAIRCAYIFFTALIAAMFPYFGDILGSSFKLACFARFACFANLPCFDHGAASTRSSPDAAWKVCTPVARNVAGLIFCFGLTRCSYAVVTYPHFVCACHNSCKSMCVGDYDQQCNLQSPVNLNVVHALLR